jgi:hypothetical protein
MSSMLDFWLFAAVLPQIQPRWGLRASPLVHYRKTPPITGRCFADSVRNGRLRVRSPHSFPRVGWQPGQRLNLSIFSGVNTAVMAGADQ